MGQPNDWDDITEPTLALTLAPSDAPPTERNLEAPTEAPTCPETLPAPIDITRDTGTVASLAELYRRLKVQ